MKFQYKTVKKVTMNLFTVIAIIDVILLKGGSGSLYHALAATMGPYEGQFLFCSKILFWAGLILFPVSLVFEVLDKKTAGEPYLKALAKNIAFGLFILTIVLYYYFSGKLFS